MRKFWLLLPLVRPDRWSILAGFVAILLTQVAQAYVPQATRGAVDAVATSSPDVSLAVQWALVVVGVTALRGVFQYVMRRNVVSASRQMERRLRNRLYERLLAQSAAWVGGRHTGDLLSRFTADVEAVRMSVGPGLMYVVNTGILAPVALFYMWRMSPSLTLVNLAPLLILAVGTKWLTPRMHAASVDVQETQAAMSTRAQESFAGVRVVKSFAREEREVAEFGASSEKSLDANLAFVDVRALFHPMIGLLRGVGMVLTLFVGGRLILDDELTIGQFIAFEQYRAMLLWPMISLGWVISLWERGIVAMGRLSGVLEDVPEVADASAPVDLGPVRGRLGVRGLTFAYPGAAVPALEDVTLTVEPGETVAVVGPTGSGKSTLLALLPRLLRAPAGTVLLDDAPVENLLLADLRRDIGYVPQDTFLFSDTIRANVGFGLDADTADYEERVRDAADRARLLPEVESFPKGFDTLLGERGVNLSGGQRQRATIARALALDPPILLLDDCLSAVDARTETEILANLREVLRGRTTLLVTHRVAAARLADRVVVIEEGRVTEVGTHEDLLDGEGFYARLARRQALEEALEAA